MHDEPTEFDQPSCALCRRPSRAPFHDDCRQHLDRALAGLPVLYRQLADALAPGRPGTTTARPATRTAPLPVRLDALDLRARGGIEGIVTSWERDVRELLDLAPPPFRGTVEQQLGGGVAFLRGNLLWIIHEHPAADEFAAEIHHTARQAAAVITGERPERRIGLSCSTCGARLTITLSTPGRRCGCGQQYGFQELRRLDLAARSAA
ncbi:hypothetical protein [Streptomyces mobaraensis]|uniref:Uncharacterized protein n=1 Tax=Streptomyces mobaraensis TaxID=35621 RepID=A0A5N5WCY8_STRMB|nr:hypothetical protein [Streptomyces mobaraensis]KAB7850142.1 hypothetical protein FRZ00_05955 [Streptomyces mobaraensis]